MPDNKEKTLRDLNPLDMKVSTAKKAGVTFLKWGAIAAVVVFALLLLGSLN